MAEQAEELEDTVQRPQLATGHASDSLLVGSQLATYEQLKSIGFSEQDSFTAAQTYGSNVEAAVNCIISGNVQQLTQIQPSARSFSPLPTLTELRDRAMTDRDEMFARMLADAQNADASKPSPFRVGSVFKKDSNRLKEITFRETEMSRMLVCGFLFDDEAVYQSEFYFANALESLIAKYLNGYFLRLIVGDSREITMCDSNKSIREIVSASHKDVARVWMRFSILKPIYPLEIVKKPRRDFKGETISISLEDVCQVSLEYIARLAYRKENEGDRWVEIPADLYDATLHILDALQQKHDSNGILEVMVEIEGDKSTTPPIPNRVEDLSYRLWMGDCVLPQPRQLSNANLPSIDEEAEEAAVSPVYKRPKDSAPERSDGFSRSALGRAVASGSVRVGDLIDAQDAEGKWYEAVVRFACDEFILVHYLNWQAKWDEKLYEKDLNSGRIARRGTHTAGAHCPGRYHKQRNTAEEFMRLCYPNLNQVLPAPPLPTADANPSSRMRFFGRPESRTDWDAEQIAALREEMRREMEEQRQQILDLTGTLAPAPLPTHHPTPLPRAPAPLPGTAPAPLPMGPPAPLPFMPAPLPLLMGAPLPRGAPASLPPMTRQPAIDADDNDRPLYHTVDTDWSRPQVRTKWTEEDLAAMKAEMRRTMEEQADALANPFGSDQDSEDDDMVLGMDEAGHVPRHPLPSMMAPLISDEQLMDEPRDKAAEVPLPDPGVNMDEVAQEQEAEVRAASSVFEKSWADAANVLQTEQQQ